MPIITAEVFWVSCDVNRPVRYENNPKYAAKWTIQIRTSSKAEAETWSKDFGMKVTPFEDEGKIKYKSSLSRYAFRSGPNGVEDTNSPNDPVNVILMDGTRLDPNTVGNGSIANISFFVKDDKSSRTLKGIQVKLLKKFIPREDPDAFTLSDDYTVVEPEVSGVDNDSPY